jgi:hypothetical protein
MGLPNIWSGQCWLKTKRTLSSALEEATSLSLINLLIMGRFDSFRNRSSPHPYMKFTHFSLKVQYMCCNSILMWNVQMYFHFFLLYKNRMMISVFFMVREGVCDLVAMAYGLCQSTCFCLEVCFVH